MGWFGLAIDDFSFVANRSAARRRRLKRRSKLPFRRAISEQLEARHLLCSTPNVTITSVNPSPVNEGNTVTVEGTMTGDCIQGMEVDWGDGTVEVSSAAEGSFSFNYSYPDDNPSGTSSDTYTLTVTVFDSNNASDSDSRSITVKNLAPTVTLNVDPLTVNEGQSVQIWGDVIDPGVLDTFTLTINWGDGTTDTLNLTSPGDYGASHTYRDDNPSNTSSDNYTITVTATDDDTGTGSASKSVTVNTSLRPFR